MRRYRRMGIIGTIAVLVLAASVTICDVGRADSVRNGDKALKAGRLDDALRAYQQAADVGSARGEAGVGMVWLRRGQYDKALSAFQKAQQMDPDVATAWYGQGEIYRRQDKCSEAIPLLERATDVNHKYPEAQLALAKCLLATGQFDRAMSALDRGLKFGRRWEPLFLVERGTAWMSRDSLRQAGIDFTRARQLAPDDPAIRKAIGEFYVERGTWALAIPELQAAVALDSTDAEAQYDLGHAQFYAEQYEQAFDTYRRLVARQPDYAPGQLGLGDLLYRAGSADPRRYAEAKAPLIAYTRLEPDDPRGWSLLGRTYYRLGVRDTALADMQKAEQLGSTNKDLYTLLGLAYADERDWSRAIDALEKGDLGPPEYLTLAQIYGVVGRPAEADSVYRIYLAGDSTSARAAFVYEQLGELHFRDKDYAGALPLFDHALALDSLSGKAQFYRGLSLNQLDRYDEALVALRKAAAIDTSSAERFFWLGVVADHQKLQGEAERAFQRCAALDTTGKLAAPALRQLGYYRLLGKKWSAAVGYLERATKLNPNDAQAWVWLGQGHQNAGNRAKAEACYRRALEIDPGNKPAKEGLRSLEKRRPAPKPKEEYGITQAK